MKYTTHTTTGGTMQEGRINRINSLFQLLERELREQAQELEDAPIMEAALTVDSLHHDYVDYTDAGKAAWNR
jgi:hypothetical protein